MPEPKKRLHPSVPKKLPAGVKEVLHRLHAVDGPMEERKKAFEDAFKALEGEEALIAQRSVMDDFSKVVAKKRKELQRLRELRRELAIEVVGLVVQRLLSDKESRTVEAHLRAHVHEQTNPEAVLAIAAELKRIFR